MRDCCFTPCEQMFSYIIAGTSQISVRWWLQRCTRSTRFVGFL